MYTDHGAWNWLLTIKETSGRLKRWRLRVADIYLVVKYKKGQENTQTDALSRLNTMSETIRQEDRYKIPTFLLESVNRDLGLNK